jgi:hypothetical protein
MVGDSVGDAGTVDCGCSLVRPSDGISVAVGSAVDGSLVGGVVRGLSFGVGLGVGMFMLMLMLVSSDPRKKDSKLSKVGGL